MTIKLLKKLRHNKNEHVAGAVLNLPEKEEERLVVLRAAEKVKMVDESVVIDPPAASIDQEYYEECYKDLHDAYNRDELAKAARETGVEFKSTAKKEEIIDAIIRQGKVDDLLTDDEEDAE